MRNYHVNMKIEIAFNCDHDQRKGYLSFIKDFACTMCIPCWLDHLEGLPKVVNIYSIAMSGFAMKLKVHHYHHM